MVSFNFVTSRLATGGAIETPADVAALQAAGVTDILNCRAEFDERALLPSGGYLWCPALDPSVDNFAPKGVQWFCSGIDFGLGVLSKPNRRLYVHCFAGQQRGPSMAYAILLAMGWSPEAARVAIVLARPITMAGLCYAREAEQNVKALGYV